VGGSSSLAITLVIVVVTHVGFNIGFPSVPTVVSLRVLLRTKITVSAFATTGTVRVEAVLSFSLVVSILQFNS
jgi:hypothetical protein